MTRQQFIEKWFESTPPALCPELKQQIKADWDAVNEVMRPINCKDRNPKTPGNYFCILKYLQDNRIEYFQATLEFDGKDWLINDDFVELYWLDLSYLFDTEKLFT